LRKKRGRERGGRPHIIAGYYREWIKYTLREREKERERKREREKEREREREREREKERERERF
jgi:hypothetical protein